VFKTWLLGHADMEIKRQPVAGKVAMPKTAMYDLDVALGKAVGGR
jgi:hypothetical protein